MTPTDSLSFVAVWFIFGMARIVFTSRLAEHRIDNPDPAHALALNFNAASARANAANYDAIGRRLLPWYRAVNFTYWMLVASGLGWALYRR